MKKTKIAITVTFMFFVIAAGAWPYLDLFVPRLDPRQVISVLATIVFAMFLYVDARIDDLGKPSLTPLIFGQLSDLLIRSLQRKDQPILSLDVFAFTTGLIQPIIASSGISASNVRIIVIAPVRGEELMSGMAGEVEMKVKSWESMTKRGTAQNLEVRYLHHLPTDYFILVNGSSLIAGSYALNSDNSASPVDVYSPILLRDDDATSAKVVASYQARFEALWKYCASTHKA